MKNISLFFGALFAFSASAADVAAVWGKPDMRLEFVQNAVVDHHDIYVGELDRRYTTDFARGLVRGGAKTINSFGVVSWRGNADIVEFAEGLRRAADTSKIVVTNVGPIAGRIVCEVLQDFERDVVFVFQDSRYNENCFSRNILPVIPQSSRYPVTALAAGELSNYAALYPDLRGARLVEAFRREQGRLANAEYKISETMKVK